MWGIRIFVGLCVLLVTTDARPERYGVKGGGLDKSTATAVASSYASANAGAEGLGTAKSSATATATAYSNGSGTSNANARAHASIDGGNIGKAVTSDETNENANEGDKTDELRQWDDRGHVGAYDDYGNLKPNAQHRDEHRCTPEGVKGHRGKTRCDENKPTQDGNSGELPDSEDSGTVNGGCEKNNRKPGQVDGEHAASPCGSEDSKCLGNRPSVSNPYPTYDKNPDSSAGSSSSVGIDGGYGGNSPKPGTINEGHSASPCGTGSSKCLGNKPSVSNPYPTYNKDPDLSTGSSNPVGIDGGYGGNSPKPGTINEGHSASPCGAGNSKCLANKPSVSNLYPTYDKNPDSSAGSSSSVGIAEGYGGNSPLPGAVNREHAASPCKTGDSKCLANKPSVSNPYPSFDKNPDSSAGSSSSVGIYGGYSPKPGTIDREHAASPCKTGDSKCLGNKPSVSNPYPSYDKNPDPSTGSSNPVRIGEGNSPKPGTIDRGHSASPCGTGNSQCLGNKPSVSNPYPTYDKNPHSSAGSSSSVGIDGGYGVYSPKPGTIDRGNAASPCETGDLKCFGNKPNVSNPYPSYDKNPDLSSGSSNPVWIDGGNSPRPGTIDRGHSASSCGTGNSQCLGNKPSVSNPYPSYDENPHSSAGASSSVGIVRGYGGNSPKPGTIGGGHAASPCGTGNSKCLGNKPSVSNPYPTYDKNPDLSTGSSNPVGIDRGNSPRPGTIDRGHSASPCGTGNSQCLANKPSVSNPNPTYDKNPHSSAGASSSVGIADKNPDTSESNSKYPINFDGVYGAKHPTDEDHNFGKRPGTSNPFLNGEVDLSGIKNPSNSGAYPGGKPNPSNPFLNPHSQVLPPSAANHPSYPSGTNGDSTTATHQYPQEGPSDIPHSGNKPKPQNPFLSHHGTTSQPKNPEADSSQNEKIPNTNPWINNHQPTSCGGSSCSSKPLGNPSTNHHEKQPGQSNKRKPEIVEDCGSGIPSAGCGEGSDNSDGENSRNDGYGSQRGDQKFGIKGVGVKGGSHHRGPPIKLQGPSGFEDNDHSRYEHEDEGHPTGNGSSGAFSSATAFSSSSGGVAKSSANAKSEAFGSGSFASSSASASASSNSDIRHHD